MSQPDVVSARLGDEDVLATVSLSGDDKLIITPTRSLLYEAEGLLSDESVSEYSHDIESVAIDTGRRKAEIELTYALEGTKTLTVPKTSLESVLHYLLAGILNARSITQPGEVVRAVFLFNELTVVITSDRVVTNVGAAVWDQEHDEYRYADLTGLEFEEGDVATQVVLYIDGRSQRIKAPKQQAKKLRHELREAVFEFFDVSSMAELRAALEAQRTDEPEDDDAETSEYPFDAAVDPLGTSIQADEDPEPVSTAPVTEDQTTPGALQDPDDRTIAEVAEGLEELMGALDDQREMIDAQQRAVETLLERLERKQ